MGICIRQARSCSTLFASLNYYSLLSQSMLQSPFYYPHIPFMPCCVDFLCAAVIPM
uniref:Uncharacterized protein n=1 Tax=Arundo donax TaxID=35708 RepID=A0A0A8Z3V3_ARUDO